MQIIGYNFHPMIINRQVNKTGDKRSRKSKLNSFEQIHFLLHNFGNSEIYGIVIGILACFKSGGNSIEGEEDGVSDPVA